MARNLIKSGDVDKLHSRIIHDGVCLCCENWTEMEPLEIWSDEQIWGYCGVQFFDGKYRKCVSE